MHAWRNDHPGVCSLDDVLIFIELMKLQPQTILTRNIYIRGTLGGQPIRGGLAGAKRRRRAERAPAERQRGFPYLQLGTRHAKNYTYHRLKTTHDTN